MSLTHLVTVSDAPALTALYWANREFLAPWEPLRDAEFYTERAQRAVIERQLDSYERGLCIPHVILDAGGQIAGRINLNNVVRGAFQSCSAGYWVSQSANGRGLATAALGEMTGLAFGAFGLHRVEAATLPHNAASQRVLERNGFARIGIAPEYLSIAGRWQDHLLFQRIATRDDGQRRS